jgi:hypothetical protein
MSPAGFDFLSENFASRKSIQEKVSKQEGDENES